MEGLDLLKKDWQKNANSYVQYSDNELYAMLHKKSSSIVRWILIISILEVAIWTFIGVFNNDDYFSRAEYNGLQAYFTAFNFIHYTIILVFIILFYKNYRAISATESTKKLMTSIIKTRKTVKFYVVYNLMMIAVTLGLGFIIAFTYNPNFSDLGEKLNNDGRLMTMVIGLVFVGVMLCIGLFWLFYRLLYGVLLRRLLANYKELEKIDLL